MSNVITINIERATSNSIQDEISDPIINGNVVSVIAYNNDSDEKVIEAVMWAIYKSELIESIEEHEANYRDIIINGRTWSISMCEFRD